MVSTLVLGLTQPIIQLVPGVLSLTVKQLGREADQPSMSNAKVKNGELYLSSPRHLHGMMLN
jgi:hypothetical protein